MPNPHIPHPFGAKHHRIQHLWKSLTSSQVKLSSWQGLTDNQGFLCPSLPKNLAGIANKQIFPQTSWAVSTGCEQLPTETSSSFKPLHPWLVPWCCASPMEGWHWLPWQQVGQGGLLEGEVGRRKCGRREFGNQ